MKKLCLFLVFILFCSLPAIAEPPKKFFPSKKPVLKKKPSGMIQQMSVQSPDLTVESVKAQPPQIKSGQTITFTAVLKNTGQKASPSTNVAFFISPQGYGEVSLPPLQPGQTYTATMSNMAFLTFCGNMSVRAVADKNNLVEESREDNNEESTQFFVIGLPDLATYDVRKAMPHVTFTGHPGEDILVKATVTNYGCKESSPSKADISCPGQWPMDIQVPPLMPGASHDISRTVKWDDTGTYTCVIHVDNSGQVQEALENNNEQPVSVGVAPPWPDTQ